MSSRALKPKPIEVAQEEAWIWGNNRGGGGAPLKDVGGTPVANLRSVIKGNARVDYSPTKSPIKPNGRARAHSPDYEDDDYDRRPRRRDHGRDRSPDRGLARSPDLVRGLENHYDQGGRNNPRGIKDMHGADPEKEARARKEMEYKAALEEQIAEKKRVKEVEKRKEDEIKRRELDEFMSNQKGSFRNKPVEKHFTESHQSPPKNKRVSYAEDQDIVGSERDDYRRGGAGTKRSSRDVQDNDDRNGGRRRRSDRDEDSDDQYRGDNGKPPRRGAPPHKRHSPPRRGRGNNSYSDDNLSDGYDEEYSDGRHTPPRIKQRSVSDRTYDKGHDDRDKRRNGNRHGDEYVTKTEYENLAALYDDLKMEHAALREELHIQNDLIKELRLQSKSKPAHGAAVAPANGHRLQNKAKAVKKAVAAFGGPVKPHRPLKNEEGLAGHKQPKEDRRPNSMSTIERKGKGVEGLGLKLPKIGAQRQGGRPRVNSEAAQPVSKRPFAEERGGGGGGGGMMALLNKKGAPVKVAYDADDGSEARRLHSPVLTNRDSSLELRGESEYIAIGGDDDGIGDAQLDRLLHQAKSARAAPGVAKKPPPGKSKKNAGRW